MYTVIGQCIFNLAFKYVVNMEPTNTSIFFLNVTRNTFFIHSHITSNDTATVFQNRIENLLQWLSQRMAKWENRNILYCALDKFLNSSQSQIKHLWKLLVMLDFSYPLQAKLQLVFSWPVCSNLLENNCHKRRITTVIQSAQIAIKTL
jgi:hypothetical protein